MPSMSRRSWYGFFRWPNGTTTWAIVLTLLAIAERTRETAIAAKAAADNIVFTHRPKLRFRGIGLIPRAGHFVEHEDGTATDMVPWEIQYVVANVCGTDAHVTESNLTLLHINLTQDGLFPEFPPYTGQSDSMGRFSVRPGEHLERRVALDEMDKMKLGVLRRLVETGANVTAGNLYCLGYIQYRDDAGVSRRTAFFRHYDAQSERFVRDKWPEAPDYYDYAD